MEVEVRRSHENRYGIQLETFMINALINKEILPTKAMPAKPRGEKRKYGKVKMTVATVWRMMSRPPLPISTI